MNPLLIGRLVLAWLALLLIAASAGGQTPAAQTSAPSSAQSAAQQNTVPPPPPAVPDANSAAAGPAQQHVAPLALKVASSAAGSVTDKATAQSSVSADSMQQL